MAFYTAWQQIRERAGESIAVAAATWFRRRAETIFPGNVRTWAIKKMDRKVRDRERRSPTRETRALPK